MLEKVTDCVSECQVNFVAMCFSTTSESVPDGPVSEKSCDTVTAAVNSEILRLLQLTHAGCITIYQHPDQLFHFRFLVTNSLIKFYHSVLFCNPCFIRPLHFFGSTD